MDWTGCVHVLQRPAGNSPIGAVLCIYGQQAQIDGFACASQQSTAGAELYYVILSISSDDNCKYTDMNTV